MELKFIEDGTNLDIQVYMREQQLSCKAIFHELCGELSFLVESPGLYREFTNITPDAYLGISFFRGTNMYCLNGKAKDAVIKNGLYLVQIDQISTVEVSTRRTFPRHEMSVPVNIYKPATDDLDTFKKIKHAISGSDTIFSGFTFDVSVEGLCILTNEEIDRESGNIFIIEMLLNSRDIFLFPAKIVRSGKATQSVQFKFDYGFLFDYTNQEHEKSKLILSIFKHKKRGI